MSVSVVLQYLTDFDIQDKLATKRNKIFQLHLNNIATLPCKNLK